MCIDRMVYVGMRIGIYMHDRPRRQYIALEVDEMSVCCVGSVYGGRKEVIRVPELPGS